MKLVREDKVEGSPFMNILVYLKNQKAFRLALDWYSFKHMKKWLRV